MHVCRCTDEKCETVDREHGKNAIGGVRLLTVVRVYRLDLQLELTKTRDSRNKRKTWAIYYEVLRQIRWGGGAKNEPSEKRKIAKYTIDIYVDATVIRYNFRIL